MCCGSFRPEIAPPSFLLPLETEEDNDLYSRPFKICATKDCKQSRFIVGVLLRAVAIDGR